MLLRGAGILLEQTLGSPVQAVGVAIRYTPSKRAKVGVVSRKAHIEDGQDLHAFVQQLRALQPHARQVLTLCNTQHQCFAIYTRHWVLRLLGGLDTRDAQGLAQG